MEIAQVPFILLCGGRNARLEPLSGTIYKPFMRLRDTTLAAQHVMRARSIGHETIRLVTDQHDPLVEAAVIEMRSDAGGDIGYARTEGGTREKILAVLADLDSDGPVVVALGDTYAWYDSGALLSRLDERVICCVAISEYRLPFGVVDYRDGMVTAFREKPGSGYMVNLGVMALGPAAVARLADGEGVGELLTAAAASGRLAGSPVAGGFISVDSLSDIARALGPEGESFL